MAAATTDLKRPKRNGNDRYGYPMLAGVRLFKRAIMAVTAAGLAVPAGHASASKIVGLCEEHADNREGVNGAAIATAERATFGFAVPGATAANIGDPVFAVDDATLDLSSSSGTRKQAGIIDGLGDGFVWVSLPR